MDEKVAELSDENIPARPAFNLNFSDIKNQPFFFSNADMKMRLIGVQQQRMTLWCSKR